MISLAIINNNRPNIMKETKASTPPPTHLHNTLKAAKLSKGDKIVINNSVCTIESVTPHPDKGYVSVITDVISMAFTPNQNVVMHKNAVK